MGGQFIPKKAIQIKNTPAGSIAATNVQAAIDELDTEKAPALGADDNYVTDAEKIVLGNTSGTNTGDSATPAETATTIGALVGGAADATPNDTDFVATSLTAAGILKKITWTNVKAFLKTYFDTLYGALATVNTWTKTQIGTVTALTSSGASIAIDLGVTNNFSHTMTENTTLAAPSNAVAGTTGVIIFTQHASAAKTLAFNAAWKPATGTTAVISTTVGSTNVMTYVVESSGVITYGWANKGIA